MLFQHEKLAAMGTMLASVAHELNNPLAVIMMEADLLHEERQDDVQAEPVKAIMQAPSAVCGLCVTSLPWHGSTRPSAKTWRSIRWSTGRWSCWSMGSRWIRLR